MRLREHPKVTWPPAWQKGATAGPVGEIGTLKEIELIEKDQDGPTRLLLTAEFDGKVHFAEVTCNNALFTHRLFEKIKPFCGGEMREIGDIEIED